VTGQPGFQWLVWPLVLVAVVLVWFAPRAVALAVPLVAAAASVVAWPPSQKLLELTLALLALAALSLGRERPPRSWLWWLSAFTAWGAHPLAAWFVSRQVLGAAWAALIFAVLIALSCCGSSSTLGQRLHSPSSCSSERPRSQEAASTSRLAPAT
jgi:hypothetical protein